MEEVFSLEKFDITYQTIRCHNTDDHNVNLLTYLLTPSMLPEDVTLVTCNQEYPGYNIDCDYREFFRDFPQALQANAGIIR
jgi:hypothetical protein